MKTRSFKTQAVLLFALFVVAVFVAQSASAESGSLGEATKGMGDAYNRFFNQMMDGHDASPEKAARLKTEIVDPASVKLNEAAIENGRLHAFDARPDDEPGTPSGLDRPKGAVPRDPGDGSGNYPMPEVPILDESQVPKELAFPGPKKKGRAQAVSLAPHSETLSAFLSLAPFGRFRYITPYVWR